MNFTQELQQELDALRARGNLRHLPRLEHDGRYVTPPDGRRMLNLSSNDYLGLAADTDLRREFLETLTPETFLPTSSSSRLLTGNFRVYDELEDELARLFGTEAALVFNCGYHANTGILPAVADAQTLILADKLVHASLIDGIRLAAPARCIRYHRLIIVTESVFSMDGDRTDLRRLTALKHRYDNVLLYVDEAHAFGVFGPTGLGCAEEEGCTADIDFLVGTFGKACASAGAYVACSRTVREFLVNRMRPFIFTTALPPVSVAWTLFVVRRLASMDDRRRHVLHLGDLLRTRLAEEGYSTPSVSQIVPMIVGPSADTVLRAEALQRHGFYALPVRPPTVPEGTSRIRFSLTAALTEEEINDIPLRETNV